VRSGSKRCTWRIGRWMGEVGAPGTCHTYCQNQASRSTRAPLTIIGEGHGGFLLCIAIIETLTCGEAPRFQEQNTMRREHLNTILLAILSISAGVLAVRSIFGEDLGRLWAQTDTVRNW